METASDWIYIEAIRIVHITESAMLVELEDQSVWLPLSQVDEVDRLEEGDENITIGITPWIAEKNGLV
jgi:hypothetical protein